MTSAPSASVKLCVLGGAGGSVGLSVSKLRSSTAGSGLGVSTVCASNLREGRTGVRVAPARKAVAARRPIRFIRNIPL